MLKDENIATQNDTYSEFNDNVTKYLIFSVTFFPFHCAK